MRRRNLRLLRPAPRNPPAGLAFLVCLGLALPAYAQADDEPEARDPMWNVHRDRPPPLHPAVWRHFGSERQRHDPHAWNFGRRRGYVDLGRRWPAQLIYRPMSPWSGMIEGRAVGEVDLGAGHAGSPVRLGASLAYGLADDDARWDYVHWGFVLGVGRGLCVGSGDGRCERRFDQVSADVIYVLGSSSDFELLVKTGVAMGPFEPAAYMFHAGGAGKWLADPVALQVEFFAQVPVNQRDTVPVVLALPVQLQVQLQRRLAMYLLSGYQGAVLSGTSDIAVPAGVGVLLGARSVDIGAEWRFPHALGTRRTWNDRSLFVTAALRYW